MANQFTDVVWPGWEVVRKLGEGSFGGVYEIQRTLPDGQVEKGALKKLTLPRNADEIEELRSGQYDEASITAHFSNQLKNLVGEYGMMKKLSGCPNIVHSLDLSYIQHDDGIGWDLYIRMELLTPLKKVLSPEYLEKTVLELGTSLCNALIACEKEHIIHRDIKPENILVSDAGVYKLGDFGVAKVAVENGTGTITGTTGYMAPEIAKHEAYGPTVDIYSLGMVLYWMMNERTLPFLPLPPQIPSPKQRQDATNCRFRGEALPEPKNGSEELKRVILKACAFNPEDRYQTAGEMMEALENCGEEKTVYERPKKPIQAESPAEQPRQPEQPQEAKDSVPCKPEIQTEKKPKKKGAKKWLLPIAAAVLCIIAVVALQGRPKKTTEKPTATAPAATTTADAENAEAQTEKSPVLELTLVPDENASFADVKHDSVVVEKRICALSPEAEIHMNEENGQIEATIPISAIGYGHDVETIIRATVNRPQKLYFVRYVSSYQYMYDDENGLINREDITKIYQSTVGDMSTLVGMPLEAITVRGDSISLDKDQPCIYLELTEDRAEKMCRDFDRDGTDTFGFDVTMSNSVVFPYTYRVDDHTFVMVAAGWKEEGLTRAVTYGLSNEELSKGYTFRYAVVPEAMWQTRDDDVYFGQMQCEYAELEDPDNTVSIRFEITNYADVSDALIEEAIRQLKDKMDIIGLPYTLGMDVQQENMVVIRTNPERLNEQLLQMLTNTPTLDTAYSTEINVWGLKVKKAEVVSAGDSGNIALQVQYTDAAKVEELTSKLRWRDDKTLYYGGYHDPFISTQITAAVQEDTLTFTQFPMMGADGVEEQYRYILELISYMLQTKRSDAFTYYRSYTFNSESAHFGLTNATEADKKIMDQIQEKYPEFEVWLNEKSDKYLYVSMKANIAPKFFETCFDQVEDIFKLCDLDNSDLGGAVFYLIDEKNGQRCRLVFTKFTGDAYMACTGNCRGDLLDAYTEDFANNASWRLFFQKRHFEMYGT